MIKNSNRYENLAHARDGSLHARDGSLHARDGSLHARDGSLHASLFVPQNERTTTQKLIIYFNSIVPWNTPEARKRSARRLHPYISPLRAFALELARGLALARSRARAFISSP